MADLIYTRNFSIIAHIDHGKSTLADRILEFTGAIDERKMKEQYLDTMDIERERGITIKSVAINLEYQSRDGKKYSLNLIDTPGHVDFSYEVSRSLAACEGALLVVDATQGVEAQTLANVYLALENDLELIPVINKIDLPSADVEKVKDEIENIIGLDTDNAVLVSAKTGEGIEDLLEGIVKYLPPPEVEQEDNDKLRALIFDAVYDSYKGVIVYVRVMSGSVKEGEDVRFLISGRQFQAIELGVFRPEMERTGVLSQGEVGYFISNIKDVRDIEIGDTMTNAEGGVTVPLAGYKKLQPVVFAGVYPQDNDDYELLKEALYKLRLNDAAIIFDIENSEALGHGFRTGFLGLLHMEIVQERLEREFGLNLIFTAPSVQYRVTRTNGELFWMDNPVMLPPVQELDMIEEPFISSQIITPQEFIGKVMDLCKEKRGEFVSMDYLDAMRVKINFTMPLGEIVIDFYDKLKSWTKGYASYEYEITGYQKSPLIKLDILVNAKVVDALSCIVHRDYAEARGREIVTKLKELIPKHLFKIPLQAAIGGKIIARETISAMRKNVLAKCYGGDVTRKRKLLEKQKAGKKRLKMIGDVEIPQSAFINVLKLGDN